MAAEVEGDAPVLPTFEEAVANDRRAADALTAALAALERAQQVVLEAREASQAAYREMRLAEARSSAGSIPLGTRVRHRTFDLTGTVVEGSAGIAVRSDATGQTVDGYGPGEWLPLEARLVRCAEAEHGTAPHPESTACIWPAATS